MTGVSVACPACHRHNVSHRLWCTHCGAAIPTSPESPPAVDQRVQERCKFYDRVVQDLEDRKRTETIAEATFDQISSFYRGQIQELKQRIARQRRSSQLHALVASARQSAHTGKLQEAIELLRQGMEADPAAQGWKEMIAEVSEKDQQRRERERSRRQAATLLSEADDLLACGQLDVAAKKLQDASALDPENDQVQAALKRARIRIAQREKLNDDRRRLAQSQALAAQRVQETSIAEPEESTGTTSRSDDPRRTRETFAEDEDQFTSPHHRWIETASQWSSIVKPFLLDNVGWFVGAFMVVAGFVVLIVTFWNTIEQNRILMHSLVFVALSVATAMFFSLAYFMRLKYPQLETSSNVLLVIVALLIPLVFAAAVLTSLVPESSLQANGIPSPSLTVPESSDPASGGSTSWLLLGRTE